jgi:predicted DNA-binding transcriptional regulator YafY
MPNESTTETDKVVQIVYTNYRQETTSRRIVPERIWFGSTPWHPHPQWLLDALDVDKQEQRSFAVADIKAWER